MRFVIIGLVIGLAGLLAGCTIRLPGTPKFLVVVDEPVDGAEGVSLTPTFRWQLLDPSIDQLFCNLYERDRPEQSVWLAIRLDQHSQMTFPYDARGKLGFGVAAVAGRLAPNTWYRAVFTYGIESYTEDPLSLEFKTGPEAAQAPAWSGGREVTGRAMPPALAATGLRTGDQAGAEQREAIKAATFFRFITHYRGGRTLWGWPCSLTLTLSRRERGLQQPLPPGEVARPEAKPKDGRVREAVNKRSLLPSRPSAGLGRGAFTSFLDAPDERFLVDLADGAGSNLRERDLPRGQSDRRR